jgi:flagellar biosynthesis chaperone FliJ
MDFGASGPPNTRAQILAKLERLTKVSQDIERLTRSLSYIQNILQLEQMKKTIDEMTQEQSAIMRDVVGMSSNFLAVDRYRALSTKLESFRDTIKNAKNTQEVLQLKVEIDATIDEWSQVFHQIAQGVLRSAA